MLVTFRSARSVCPCRLISYGGCNAFVGNKIVVLEVMGKPKEAWAAYDVVADRFGESEDVRLLEPVARAHNAKAWMIYEGKDSTRLDAAGEDFRAPEEVMEVALDIVKKIEKVRGEC